MISGVPERVFPIQSISKLENRMENVLYDSTVVAELEEAEDILSNNDELKTNSK